MSSDNNAVMGLPIEVGQQVPNVDFPIPFSPDNNILFGNLLSR